VRLCPFLGKVLGEVSCIIAGQGLLTYTLLLLAALSGIAECASADGVGRHELRVVWGPSTIDTSGTSRANLLLGVVRIKTSTWGLRLVASLVVPDRIVGSEITIGLRGFLRMHGVGRINRIKVCGLVITEVLVSLGSLFGVDALNLVAVIVGTV